MKSFFKNIISTILGILLSFFIVIIVIVSVIAYGFSSVDSNKNITIKNNSVLKIDLSSLKVMERTNNNPLNNLGSSGEMNKSIELKQVLDNIKKAATDEKIDAIFIESPSVNAGLSQIEEIRNQLLEFKKSGKKIIAYSEVYSQVAYYLSSIANKIYLHPEGIVELKGLSAEQIFFTGLFKKLDIEMQIIRHGKFKSAVEPFTLKKMSKDGHEIGAHTLNHPWLSKLNENSQIQEINKSVIKLKKMGLIKKRWSFCYPYGDYNKLTLKILKKLDCSAAFKIGNKPNTLKNIKKFELNRVDCNVFK